MHEELKARLRSRYMDTKKMLPCALEHEAANAIEQLERHLAERDAEIAKYRDAPVVAWVEVVDSYEGPYHFNGEKLLNVGKHKLIVKPGEEK